MSMKTGTNLELEIDDRGGELSTMQPEQVVRPEKPKPTRVNFVPIPNYATDRRHDVRSRDYANAVTLPYRDGYLERFEQTAEAGFYFVELRVGNQIVGGDVYEVKATGRGVPQSQGNRPATAAQPAAQVETPANAVNSVTDAVRAVKDLQKELAPQPAAAAPTTADDIKRMIAEGVREALAQAQPAQPAAPPVDPLAMVREVRKLQRELAPPAPPAAPSDPAESFLSQFEKFTEISERINPIRERDASERGWLDKILGTVEGIAKATPRIAEIASPFITAAMMGAARPQQQPTAAAQTGAAGDTSQAAPAASGNPAQDALMIIVEDLKRNKRVGRAAYVIDELVTKQPEYAPMLKGFLQRPERDILIELSQLAGEDLTDYTHAESWIEDLRLELSDEDEGDGATGDEPMGGDAPNIVNMASARVS